MEKFNVTSKDTGQCDLEVGRNFMMKFHSLKVPFCGLGRYLEMFFMIAMNIKWYCASNDMTLVIKYSCFVAFDILIIVLC